MAVSPLLLILGRLPAGTYTPPGAGNGWNPEDAAAGLLFTNEDRTVTDANDGINTGERAVRSKMSKSTGKWYFDVSIISFNGGGWNAVVGVMDENQSLTSGVGKDSENGVGYYANGSIYNDGDEVNELDSYGAGDVVGCAVDLDTGDIWFHVNGNYGDGDPEAGLNAHATFAPQDVNFGEAYAACSMNTSVSNQWTGNFTSETVQYPPPTGFTAWED